MREQHRAELQAVRKTFDAYVAKLGDEVATLRAAMSSGNVAMLEKRRDMA
jgi:hypothetical protein